MKEKLGQRVGKEFIEDERVKKNTKRLTTPSKVVRDKERGSVDCWKVDSLI